MNNDTGTDQSNGSQLAPRAVAGRAKTKSKGKAGNVQAREVMAEVVTSADTAVALMLTEAQDEAERKVAERKGQLVNKLSNTIADASMTAMEQASDFLLRTIGTGDWLLLGAQDLSEVVDGEIMDQEV